MVRAYRASLLLLALPLAATPALAQVCHPVHHHRVVHLHKVAHASGISVIIDQTRLVAFPKPVKTVFIGNPTIADITMVDPQHAFVFGKTFGLTNLVALGEDGKQVQSQQVVVYNNVAAVTINRGPDQYDYMCTHVHCESSPRPGDPSTFVTTTESATQQHEANANGAGNSAGQGQQAQNGNQ